MAAEAIEFARATAQELGPQAPEAKQAMKFAAEAHGASLAAIQGQIEPAAKSAQQAAEAVKNISPEKTELAGQARELQQRQQALAQ